MISSEWDFNYNEDLTATAKSLNFKNVFKTFHRLNFARIAVTFLAKMLFIHILFNT